MLKITLRQFNKFKSIYNISSTVPSKYDRLLPTLSPVHHTIKESSSNFHNQRSKTSEDGEYLVRLQNNPEVFGAEPQRFEKVDKYDMLEDEHLTNQGRSSKQLSTRQYADMIKSLIRKKKIKEAIDIVEVKMLKVDKVQPENYLYNLLMGACGKVGYTKKAFQLYNDMKKRGLKVHPGAYTALFNACANSPWQEDGLSRAKHLHNIMIEQLYEPNDSNYHAMIKAYGRCGDINAAFALVDEMIEKKFLIKDDTMNFLMQACISDKEAGFRHALLVWHKFLKKKVKPSLFTYNLLLRATRDCGLGDIESTKDVLKKILPSHDKFLQIDDGINGKAKDLQAGSDNAAAFPLATEEIAGGMLEFDDLHGMSELNRPNLLSESPRLGNIILINEITKAEDRLLLLGGGQNFLQEMELHECKPDIKTFTQLLDCLPGSITAETELLSAMKKSGTKADLDFYNMLIKKRSMRFDYAGAKDVMQIIHENNFQPDLITYGVLALGCKNRDEAENFLLEMEAGKYRLNAEILGAMLHQSTFHLDFPYIIFVMDRCVQQNIQPNAIFMGRLDKFYNKCKKISNDSASKLGKTKSYQKGWQIFKMRYKSWKDQVTPEEDVHPWQQYRQPVDTDVRHYKEKANTSQFKARHLTKYRQQQPPTEIVKKYKSHKFKHKRNSREQEANPLRIE